MSVALQNFITIEHQKSMLVKNYKAKRLELFCKKNWFEKYRKLHRGTPFLDSFFQSYNFTETRLWHKYFPVNSMKFFRTTFLCKCINMLLSLCLPLNLINLFLSDISFWSPWFSDVFRGIRREHWEEKG